MEKGNEILFLHNDEQRYGTIETVVSDDKFNVCGLDNTLYVGIDLCDIVYNLTESEAERNKNLTI